MGPKHCGKTSTGAELAQLLKLPFFDLDTLIEERTGRSPRDLLDDSEESFRLEEEAALAVILQNDLPKNTEFTGILAAGGGFIDNSSAMDKLCMTSLFKWEKPDHHTIFLDLPAKTAWQRILAEGTIPPFLKAKTKTASREKHQTLHDRRVKAYRQFARITVSAAGKTPAELAEEIARTIQLN